MEIDVQFIAAAEDQRAAIFEAVSTALAGVAIYRNRLLVASYIRPERTAGGIYRPQSNLKEDRFQGVCGVILQMGPTAFDFDEGRPEEVPSVGDWIFYRASESTEFGMKRDDLPHKGISVRIIKDEAVIGRTTDPTFIW